MCCKKLSATRSADSSDRSGPRMRSSGVVFASPISFGDSFPRDLVAIFLPFASSNRFDAIVAALQLHIPHEHAAPVATDPAARFAVHEQLDRLAIRIHLHLRRPRRARIESPG